jgi:hypothetical protein
MPKSLVGTWTLPWRRETETASIALPSMSKITGGRKAR